MPGISIRRLDTRSGHFKSELDDHLRKDRSTDIEIRSRVEEIIREIVEHRDLALLRYTAQYDQLATDSVADLEVSNANLKKYWDELPLEQQDLLEISKERVRTYHFNQLTEIAQKSRVNILHTDDLGNRLAQLEQPLNRVGLYIPGGTAAYPSTVIMTATLAKVAGVPELIATVPTPNNQRNPLIFAALYLCDVDRVFTVGGAQAIAALAYGTESIPPVDKIVGPGNAYVTEAKAQVVRDVGIDGIAGPSEILVIADSSANPKLVALDLLSQAEHDPSSQAVLITNSQATLDNVEKALNLLLSNLPRVEIASASLRKRGLLIKVENLEEASEISNQLAPEHLEIVTENPGSLLPNIRSAGAIFLGQHSSEVLGDYIAGPSHVLPTAGTARFSSPLSVHDFLKRSSVIDMSKEGASVLGKKAANFADLEGLHAHALAAAARISSSE